MTGILSAPDQDDTEALPRLVILISGSGSNMLAIADQIKDGQIQASISAVICNQPEAAGVQKAKDRDITTQVVNHKDFSTREDFDMALMRAIDEFSPDLIVLAGFMRILTADFVRRYEGRMLNIHPSLLPRHKGINTHKKVLESGDNMHGTTVHFVTEDLDDGPNVIQASLAVLDGDDEVSLQHRVQQQEHIIYPIAVKWFTEGRLRMRKKEAFLDNQQLPMSGLQLES